MGLTNWLAAAFLIMPLLTGWQKPYTGKSETTFRPDSIENSSITITQNRSDNALVNIQSSQFSETSISGTPEFQPTPVIPSKSLQEPVDYNENSSTGTNPFTGLAFDQKWPAGRRPVMVKISNSLNVRPQSGLSYADLVFEYYIGEGINRFLALFYGEDVMQAGPIRSGRMVDAQLVNMYQGILVYGSADPRVDQIITLELGERAISHLEIGCPVICGLDTHSDPGVFGNTYELTQYSKELGNESNPLELQGLFFSSIPPQKSEFAVKIGVQYAKFNRGEWRYNPDTLAYDRWTDNQGDSSDMIPLLDQLTEKMISVSNVIIIFSEYTEFNPTLHDISIRNNKEGQRALFFRDGIMVDGYWLAAGQNQPIQFFDQSGLPLALKPGKSWIVLAGVNSIFETPKAGIYELLFKIP